MKRIYTFLFTVVCCVNIKAQEVRISGRLVYPVSAEEKNTTRIVIRCRSSLGLDTMPLIVVDGIPYSHTGTENVYGTALSGLQPDDIESFHVLKGSAASALYGCRAFGGIILITTKRGGIQSLLIKDTVNAAAVPGATVLFTYNADKDTTMLSADDKGKVDVAALDNRVPYTVTVSAVGYKTKTLAWSNIKSPVRKEIYLERDVKTCEEVVLVAFGIRSCGSVFVSCGGNRYTIKNIHGNQADSIIQNNNISAQRIKIFPTILQKGQTLTVIPDRDINKAILRITGAGGQVVYNQPVSGLQKANRLQITTDSRWAAGMYFVQFVYANGGASASERIIVN